ncbi:hypothetical protein ACFQMA_05340 [Halosimplex aquaticum]|uniref:Uncharacterized protein n=1 Tax=Halosimplex aquaticum TaxID=3026162 RepID=A0ABD5XXB2_9EURY|nr:hypothetical protein [Halosimplex aquaticum]
MGSSFTNIVLPVAVAIGTVFLTFWFREKQATLSALRAIKTELKHNDELVESMVHDLFSDRPNNLQELLTIDTVPLQTSAFDHFVNSGTATKIPDDTEDAIWYHYLVVRMINRDIENRLDSVDKNDLKKIDDRILNRLLYLCDTTRLEVMENNIRNDDVEKQIQDAIPTHETWESSSEGQTHWFTGVRSLIDEEIERKHWIPTFIFKLQHITGVIYKRRVAGTLGG